MKKSFSDPKGFGEILDHTFHLSKKRFIDFAKIFLILIGPVIVLEALVQFSSGMSLFRETGTGSNWFERALSTFEEDDIVAGAVYASDLWLLLFGFITLLLFPVAQAAVLFGVDHIRRGEEFAVGSVIKQAFSRFWAMIGSSILFGLIIIAMMVAPIILVSTVFLTGDIATAVIILILVLIGSAIGFGLILTRLSLYFGSVVLDKKSPGFGRSWELSKGRTWSLFGLYIVLTLIIGVISFAVEATLAGVLGNSVLLLLINNLVLLFTTIIFSVGYAVIFFDLKTRRHGDDLKGMLQDYKEDQQPDSTL